METVVGGLGGGVGWVSRRKPHTAHRIHTHTSPPSCSTVLPVPSSDRAYIAASAAREDRPQEERALHVYWPPPSHRERKRNGSGQHDVLPIEVAGHENAGTARVGRALAPEAGDLAVAVHLVVLQDGELDLLVHVLRLLGGGVYGGWRQAAGGERVRVGASGSTSLVGACGRAWRVRVQRTDASVLDWGCKVRLGRAGV